MNRKFLLVLLLSLSFLSLKAADKGGEEPVDLVNPFIGTSNFGTTNPGAVCPNGLMSVVPFNVMGSDLNKFDKLIDDFEPEMRMPVLIKKYIKQNAKVVAFNVDPNFNDAIDGLMYIRIRDLPEDTIKPVLEEISDQLKEFEEKNKKS